jgi:hypothetical protein
MKVVVIKTVDIAGREVYLDSNSILYAVKSMGDDFKVHGMTIEEATQIISAYCENKKETVKAPSPPDNGETIKPKNNKKKSK